MQYSQVEGDHSCRVLFSFLQGREMGERENRLSQPSQGGAPLCSRKWVVAPVALSQNLQLYIGFFLFSWVCKSS